MGKRRRAVSRVGKGLQRLRRGRVVDGEVVLCGITTCQLQRRGIPARQTRKRTGPSHVEQILWSHGNVVLTVLLGRFGCPSRQQLVRLVPLAPSGAAAKHSDESTRLQVDAHELGVFARAEHAACVSREAERREVDELLHRERKLVQSAGRARVDVDVSIAGRFDNVLLIVVVFQSGSDSGLVACGGVGDGSPATTRALDERASDGGACTRPPLAFVP